jgi:WD40 repeat protein
MIYDIKCTPGSDFLLLSDEIGYLKQFDLVDEQLIEDYGIIHQGCIYSMGMSKNGRYLWTSDDQGCVKEWDTWFQRLVRDWGQVHEHPILSICVSVSGLWLYTTDALGWIKVWRIKTRILLKVKRFYFSKIVSTCPAVRVILQK